MRQFILIILVVLGLGQSLYYNFNYKKIDENQYNYKSKREIKYKDIIINLDKFNTVSLDKIIKNGNNYIIDINFEGNLKELKEFIDYMNGKYNVCNCMYKSIEKEDELISGKIAINIS